MATAAYDEQTRAECQRYLASFRVTELKELLKAYSQSQRGRKSELFQRANDILQFGTPKFQNKIRDIYGRTRQTKRLPKKQLSPVKTGLVNKSPSHAYIVHPDVTFKEHPFFAKMDTIIRPTALMSTGMSSHGALSMKVTFHLTPQQINHIYLSKTSTGAYQTQVLVRFCLQETTCEQNDLFPKQCYVKVNGHPCSLPGYHPHLSGRPDYKRTGQPVNITNYVKTSPTEANEVLIYWSHDIMLPQGYCVGVEMCKNTSSADLLQALKAKGLRSPDMSRALVKEKFKVDQDSEISATSLKVSLLCPIGKMRMSYPCRTLHCNHLQCFDASIYYQMNEKKARWVCPVCDKKALPQDLFIDGLFMEICQQCSSSTSIIEFLQNGSWIPASDKIGSSLTVSVSDKRGNSPITVDLAEPQKNAPVVIDLTVSSDEDEEVDVEEEEEEEGEGEEEEAVEVEKDGANKGAGGDEKEEDREPSLLRQQRQISIESTLSDSESTHSASSSSSSSSSTIVADTTSLYTSRPSPSSSPSPSSPSTSSSSSTTCPSSSFSLQLTTHPQSSLWKSYEASSLPLPALWPTVPTVPTRSNNVQPMSVITHSFLSRHSSSARTLAGGRDESARVPGRGLGSVPSNHHLSRNRMYPVFGDALLSSSFIPVALDKNLQGLFNPGYLKIPTTSSSTAGLQD